jgi:hypothetical protein
VSAHHTPCRAALSEYWWLTRITGYCDCANFK